MTRFSTAVCLLAGAALATPAVAQENQAAPASDATPIDVDAVQSPWARPDIEISHRDRIYVSDSGGDVICGIDPAAAALSDCVPISGGIATPPSEIKVGGDLAELAATRKGDLIALLRKDRSEITITATAADAVAKTIRLSSEPSGAAFTRDGRELWVALPKENQIAVFEMRAFRQTALLEVPSGPASIAMSVDGHRAFASMTYAQEIRTFDVKRKTEIARVASTYPGAGRLAVTPNGKALWAYHPNGEIDVIATKPPFKARPSARLEGAIGSLTFVHVGLDSFAYASSPVSSSVSVFDADSFRKVASVRLEAEASGIWTSGDGTAVYAALPTANKVVQIDTASNRVVGTVKVPGTPNALIYVPGAVHQRRAVAKGLP